MTAVLQDGEATPPVAEQPSGFLPRVTDPAHMGCGTPTAHFTREDMQLLTEHLDIFLRSSRPGELLGPASHLGQIDTLALPRLALPPPAGGLRLRRSRSMELPADKTGRSRPGSPALHRLERATPFKQQPRHPSGLRGVLGPRQPFPIDTSSLAHFAELPCCQQLHQLQHQEHYMALGLGKVPYAVAPTGSQLEMADPRRRLTSNQSEACHAAAAGLAGHSPSSAAFAAQQAAHPPPTTAGLHGIGEQLDMLLSQPSGTPAAAAPATYTPGLRLLGCGIQGSPMAGTDPGRALSSDGGSLFSPNAGLLFASPRSSSGLFSPSYRLLGLLSPGL